MTSILYPVNPTFLEVLSLSSLLRPGWWWTNKGELALSGLPSFQDQILQKSLTFFNAFQFARAWPSVLTDAWRSVRASTFTHLTKIINTLLPIILFSYLFSWSESEIVVYSWEIKFICSQNVIVQSPSLFIKLISTFWEDMKAFYQE